MKLLIISWYSQRIEHDLGVSTGDGIALVAIIISLIALVFSIWYNLKSAKTNICPVLVAEYNESNGWSIRNIGNGPALNVLVAQKRIKGGWFNIGQDDQFHLKWLGHFNDSGLGISYQDFNSKKYSSTISNDLTNTFSKDILPSWEESDIGKFWNYHHYTKAEDYEPGNDKFA